MKAVKLMDLQDLGNSILEIMVARHQEAFDLLNDEEVVPTVNIEVNDVDDSLANKRNTITD